MSFSRSAVKHQQVCTSLVCHCHRILRSCFQIFSVFALMQIACSSGNKKYSPLECFFPNRVFWHVWVKTTVVDFLLLNNCGFSTLWIYFYTNQLNKVYVNYFSTNEIEMGTSRLLDNPSHQRDKPILVEIHEDDKIYWTCFEYIQDMYFLKKNLPSVRL